MFGERHFFALFLFSPPAVVAAAAVSGDPLVNVAVVFFIILLIIFVLAAVSVDSEWGNVVKRRSLQVEVARKG